MADLRDKGPFQGGVGLGGPTSEEIFTPEEGELEAYEAARRARLGDFELGLQSGARGVQAGGYFRRADKAEAEGDLDTAQALRAQASRLQEGAADFAPRVGSTADIESAGDVIDFAQAGFGQLAPTMAATSVPGIIGGIAGGILTGGNPLGIAAGAGLAAGLTGFEMEAGEAAAEQQADEAIRALPVAQRLREQNIKGAQAAALELVFPTMVGGRLAGSVAKIFKKLDTAQDAATAAKRLKTVKRAGRVNVAEATAEEGGGAVAGVFKETVSEAGTEASQTLVAHASLNRLNPNRDRSGDVQEIIDATILGALGGGGMSLGTTIPGALAKKALGAQAVELDEDGAPKPPGAGARIRDQLIKAGAGVTEGVARIKDTDIVKGAKAKIKESDLPFIAKNVSKAAQQTVADTVQAVKDSDAPFIVKNVGKAVKERLSDAELERRARLRKSSFNPSAQSALDTVEGQVKQEQEDAAAMEDFAASSRFEASAEEITGLRELDPISKEESKGQRRYVRMQGPDVDSHLSDLVARGVLTQEVADAAKVEPLGTNMERKGASTQEMENELSGIVRDILRRIEDGRKKGGTATEVADRNKALESELGNLPIDVSKRGEVLKETAKKVVDVETRVEHKRKTATKDQQELFPEDIGKTFPVEMKEIKTNHFGFIVDLAYKVEQGELALGKADRKGLLVRALNQYGKVLASDAAATETAATVAEHKANRSKYEQASSEEKRQMESEGKVIRLRKKNGQNEVVDAESVLKSALAADREGIVGNIRGKAKQDEAGLLAGLAKELLRNDIEGIVDPQTGKVARGERQKDLLGAYVKGTGAVSAATRVADVQAKAAQDKAITGKRQRKSYAKGDIRVVIAGEKRADIQKGFRKALKDHLTIDSKADRDNRIKVLSNAAKTQRKVLADLKKFNKEYAENKHVGPGLTPLELEENDQLVETLKVKYGAEVGVLFGNRPRTGTAQMRADRLEALVADLNELNIEETAEAAGVAEEIEGGRAETLEEKGVRHAEEQTGAGTQVRVGAPLKGEKPGKTVPKKARVRQKNQFQALAARLRKAASAQAVRDLLPKALGYKSVGNGVFTRDGSIVFLGKYARKDVEGAATEAGMNVRKVSSLKAGERVTLLVAKADLETVLKSKEMTTLLASGAEIVMPAIAGKYRTEFANNGYKKLEQSGGVEVWVPALGEQATSSSRNAAFEATEDTRFMQSLSSPLGGILASPDEMIDSVQAAVGEKNMKNIDFAYSDEQKIGKNEVAIGPKLVPMGKYSLATGRITIFIDNVVSKEKAAWTAWHELVHRGLDVATNEIDVSVGGENGVALVKLLDIAKGNKTVAALGAAIQKQRGIESVLLGVEEALAELGAAMKTGEFSHLQDKYGVKVSRTLMTGEIKGWINKLREIIAKVLGIQTDKETFETLDYVLDEDISGQEFAGSRARTEKFSRETADAEPLTKKERAERKTLVKEWLAKVLGVEIADMFRDVLGSETDVAGSYDWKTTVIELAIDSASWYGTAAHEAFHAFFHKMGKIDGNRQVYNRLLKAANAPHIKRQLRALLKDSPEALAQLKDPEERLAYMFQFYMTEQINLQPQTLKTFRKWARKLGELLGMVSKHESAQRIFEAFARGDLRDGFAIRDMLIEEQATGFAKSMNSIIDPIKEGLFNVLASATDRLRATGNKSLTQLADLFAPEVRAGGEAGYIASKARTEAQFRNGFDEILERHAEGKDPKSARKSEKEALSILQGQLEAEDGTLASDLRKYLAEMFEYLRDTDNDIFNDDGTLQSVSPNAVHQLVSIKDGVKNWEVIKDEGPRYFPRAWDIQTILNNWSEFKKIMEEEGGLEGEALSNFKHALEQSDGMVEIDLNNAEFDAAMRAVNSRTFDFINQDNAHRFSKFQEQDLSNILTKYARQSANRGEQTRHFGKDNEKIAKLLRDAKKEGASKAELKMAEKAVKALEGTLGVEAMSPLKKNLMMTAMTAVNFAVLPLALFSSLVDPLGVLVRTGSLPAAARTFQAGAAQIVADIRGSKTQHQKFAEFMGIVEQEQMLAVTGDAYNSMFQNETLRKLNARFFKIIGLDSWTKGTRIGAMVAGMLYMRDHATDKRALAELGLQEGDIQMSATQPDYVETSPEVLGRDKARRVQAALFRMVDESILRPSAAQRPIFMSDIRFMLLGHLKQFTFSFHNTIVKQVSNNINNKLDDQDYIGAMQQVAPLLAYVPMMIAADMLRAAVGGRLDDDDDKEWSLGATIFEGVQRSAILGTRTFALDAGEEAFGFNSLPISTFLGPVISKGTKLTEAAIDPDTSFMKAGTKMLPGYAFWKGWME